MIDDLSGIALLYDDAVIHENELIRYISGKCHLMRDDDHRRFLLCESPDDL